MFKTYVFDHISQASKCLYQGSHRECLSFRESYLLSAIQDLEGIATNFQKYVSYKKDFLSRHDYRHNRVYISKSHQNTSKLTLNTVDRYTGYIYTGYSSKKLLSVYVLHDGSHALPTIDNKNYPSFEYYDEFNECINQLLGGAHIIKPEPKPIESPPVISDD